METDAPSVRNTSIQIQALGVLRPLFPRLTEPSDRINVAHRLVLIIILFTYSCWRSDTKTLRIGSLSCLSLTKHGHALGRDRRRCRHGGGMADQDRLRHALRARGGPESLASPLDKGATQGDLRARQTKTTRLPQALAAAPGQAICRRGRVR